MLGLREQLQEPEEHRMRKVAPPPTLYREEGCLGPRAVTRTWGGMCFFGGAEGSVFRTGDDVCSFYR